MIKKLRVYIQADKNFASILHDAGFMYVAGIISIAFTFAQQISTASLLGVEDYGRFAIILATTTVLTLVLDVRTWELATKLLTKPILNKESAEILQISNWLKLIDLALGFIGALLLIGFSELIAEHLLGDRNLAWLFRLYALCTILRMYTAGVPVALVRMYNRFDWLSYKSIAYAVVRLVFITGFVYLGWGITGAIIGAIVSEILNAIFFIVIECLLWRHYNKTVSFFTLKKPLAFKEILQLIPGSWLFATLKSLQMELFIPITALLTSPAEVGLLRSGLDIANLVTLLSAPLGVVFYPKIIETFEHQNIQKVKRVIKQSVFLTGAFVIPLTVFIILAGPLILPLIFESNAYSITLVASFISIGFCMNAILLWSRPALVAANLMNIQNKLSIVLLCLVILSLWILVPSYGALGTALVIGIFFVIFSVLSSMLFLQKATTTNHYAREVVN